MKLESARLIEEVLQELIPDPEIDFGPAYESTKERKKEALRLIRQEIRWMKAMSQKL